MFSIFFINKIYRLIFKKMLITAVTVVLITYNRKHNHENMNKNSYHIRHLYHNKHFINLHSKNENYKFS